MKRLWSGTIPAKCDVCSEPVVDRFNDMKTVMGPWACLCDPCVEKVGVGFGLGRGQGYKKQPDGTWLKDRG